MINVSQQQGENMNLLEFKARAEKHKAVLHAVRDALGPLSALAAIKLTGCAAKSFYRVLEREGGTTAEFKKGGPTATKMTCAELALLLNENMPERTPSDFANILRAVADKIERVL